MKKLISKETESDLSKLGLYQIIGGALGICIILWSLFNSAGFSGITLLIYLFIILFFLYSIYCGILCLNANKNALKHSLANQLLQFIGFAVLGFAFNYAAGIYLSIGLDLTNSIKFSFGAGISKFVFNFNNEKELVEIDFNVVALLLVIWIDKLMKRVKEEVAIRQVSSIGEI